MTARFVQHWLARVALGVLLVPAIGSPGAAQVMRSASSGHALRLIRTDGQPGGVITYYYELGGPPQVGAHSEVLLWLEQPIGDPPQPGGMVRRAVGSFLIDAATDSAAAPWRHPDLVIVTPPHWNAAIFPDAALHWGAERVQGVRTYGVLPGKTKSGFALESRALPAFRRYRVIPERPFESESRAERPGMDSSYVLLNGLTIAPGWMPETVHWGFLYDQLRLACEAQFVAPPQCGRYYRWLDRFRAAHAQRNDQAWDAAAVGMDADVRADTASHPWAGFVFRSALSAMRRRPPSRLPVLPADAAGAPPGAL